MKKVILTICCVLCFIIFTIHSGFNPMVIAESTDVQITSKSAYLVDFNTGTVLFEKEPNLKLPVASMVKLMTILLTFEEIEKGNLKLDELVSTTDNASGMGGSQVFIDPYVEYKVEDLLKSVIVASANDASVALAEKISGSEANFVAKMNAKAKELGMQNTSYINCTGLPAPMQYSTAKDVSTLNRELLNHKNYYQYSTIWMDKLIHPSGRETELVNTNKLIRYFKGCDSGKTGSTDEAGFCLSASAERDGLRLISTIVGGSNSKTRFNEVSDMFSYGFANYENKKILSNDEKITQIKVSRSSTKCIDVYAIDNFYGLTKKGEKASFELKLECPEKVNAPIQKGDTIGKILVIKNGQIIKEIDAISNTTAEKYTYKDGLNEIIENWKIKSA